MAKAEDTAKPEGAADDGRELALGAMQAQIADVRELVDQLRGQVDRVLSGDNGRARLDRAICLITAIVGELESNAVKSDFSQNLAELKQLIAPILKRAEEETRNAA